MAKRREIKFYQTEEFKKLNAIWVKGQKKKIIKDGKVIYQIEPSKLAESGFIDSEIQASYDYKRRRTQGYLDKEAMARLSNALMAYLENPSISLKDFEVQILKLRSEGVYRKHIIEITGKSHQTVWKTIKRHSPLALGLYEKDAE